MPRAKRPPEHPAVRRSNRLPEPPVAMGRGSTAYPPSNGKLAYGPGEEYQDNFREAELADRYAQARRWPSKPPRPRVPWYARKRFMFPIAFLLGVAAMLGLMWWFTPVKDPVTGTSSPQGNKWLKLGRQLVAPKQDLKSVFSNRSQVRVLLVGVDSVPGRRGESSTHRSDSMLVCATDFDTKQMRMLSVPRDGWVMHYENGEELGQDKLNAAYSMGQQEHPDDPAGGVARTSQTIEHLLNVPIEYYMVIDFDGFKKVIDALGGLDVDVEKKMDYDDNAGNLHVHLKPGLQHLSGEQAMGYARFRHDALSDITRMGRQQKVLRLVLEELQKPQNLPRLPALFSIFNQSLTTNLSWDQMLAISQNIEEYKTNGLQTMTLESFGRNDKGLYPLEGRARAEWAQFIPQESIDKGSAFLSDLSVPPPPKLDDADKAWASDDNVAGSSGGADSGG